LYLVEVHTRRVARLALLATMAIGLGACASSAAEEAVHAQDPAATTPATMTPAASAPTTTAEAVATPAAPAVIEVRYTGDPSQRASASIDGPDGVRRAAVDDVASFDGLSDGSYQVTVSFESQPTAAGDGVDIGTAYSTINVGTLTVVAGDHGVVTCDTEGCTAVL
jgi:hypothetical protein